MMSVAAKIGSKNSQEGELVPRRPLLTKQFIPNQNFQQASTSNEEKQLPIICDSLKQQASTSNEEKQLPIICDSLKQNQEPTVQQGQSSKQQAIQITEEDHSRETPTNTASNLENNLFNGRHKKKTSKKVKLTERNKTLMKTIQPKGAPQILNELVTTTYYYEELHNNVHLKWKAIIHTNGLEYVGYGHSKVAAKNSVAEVALKDIYHRMQNCIEQGIYYNILLPQITCYALFKMFSSWGIGGNNYRQIPENNYYEPSPEKMDPILLITEKMFATFEEVPQGSHPKNIIYLFKCHVGDYSFFGTGKTKIMAKRNAAYEACAKLMGIKYPKKIYVSMS